LTIIKLKKIAALSLALVLLLAGCQAADTSWAFEWEGERMPAGVYILYINQALVSATNQMHQEWLNWQGPEEDRPPSLWDLTSSEILDLQVDGIRLYDWVIHEGQRLARHHFAVQALLSEFEIELDPVEMAAITAAAQRDYQAQEAHLRGLGVAESSMVGSYRARTAQFSLFFGLYGEGGAFEVPEAEVRNYFDQNFVRGQELIIWLEEVWEDNYDDETALAEARQVADQENARLRALAGDFLARMRDGEAIEVLQYELDRELRGPDANVTQSVPGELDVLLPQVLEGQHSFLDEILVDSLIATPVGQSGQFENDGFILLVRRMDIFANPNDLEERRERIIHSLSWETDFLALLDERAGRLPVLVNQAAIDRYGPGGMLD